MDYLNDVRKKNVGQRTRYYVKGRPPVIIFWRYLIKCRRKCLIEPDCSEQLMAIRLAVVTDIAANICLVIYWYVGIAGKDLGVEQNDNLL